jgi:DNA-binding transcriptional LysR family regulator|tara:strand:- start:92 stop:949 length:858 start_codon:yes stop_codon:yes gene_type:complete
MFFTELRAFHAVAQSGGFVRASELISRSQSTLTAQVLSLEQRYGVELFFRGRGRTARLTPLGEKLYETTIQLFSLEKDAEALVLSAGQNKGGTLRVGAISPRWATGIMTQMMKRYPGLEVNLTLDNSKTLLDMVLSYQIDLAYVGAHLPNTDCEMRIISEPEIVFAVSKKHPLCTKGSVSRDEFKEQTLIQREIGSETRNLMDTALGQNGYIPGRVAIFGSREGALQAAQEGLGLAPVSTDEIPENLQVAKIRAADFQIYGEIHAVCLKSRRDLPIIAEALEARA